MEEKDAGHCCDVGIGIRVVTLFHAPGQKSQSEGQDDAEAFYCQQGIILDKALFLADV